MQSTARRASSLIRCQFGLRSISRECFFHQSFFSFSHVFNRNKSLCSLKLRSIFSIIMNHVLWSQFSTLPQEPGHIDAAVVGITSRQFLLIPTKQVTTQVHLSFSAFEVKLQVLHLWQTPKNRRLAFLDDVNRSSQWVFSIALWNCQFKSPVHSLTLTISKTESSLARDIATLDVGFLQCSDQILTGIS